MTHICVGELTIIGSDNGLSSARRQAIIWTNAEILLIGPLGINFSEILIGIQTFSLRKMHLTMSSAKWRPFCLGLNVLTRLFTTISHSSELLYITINHKLAVASQWIITNHLSIQSRWTKYSVYIIDDILKRNDIKYDNLFTNRRT